MVFFLYIRKITELCTGFYDMLFIINALREN
jgi:hypothetical protein